MSSDYTRLNEEDGGVAQEINSQQRKGRHDLVTQYQHEMAIIPQSLDEQEFTRILFIGMEF